MSIYDEMQQVAKDLIGDPEFNQGGTGKIEYVVVTPGAGPIDNPGASTFTKIPVDAVAKGVSFKYVKDGLALSSDKTVIIPITNGITPKMTDFIDIDGKRHKIIQDISVPGASTRVVWKFIVRKGQ